MTMRDKLNQLELYELTEILISVKLGYGLETELEARQHIEAGQYTKEEIIDAIAYERTEGLGPHRDRMDFLPHSLIGVEEDYGDKL